MRTHRVGTITLGTSLVVFGVLFCVQFFTKAIDYAMILRLWPLILIGLGIEILLSCVLKKEGKLLYDVPAILLTCVLGAFSMAMAGVQMIVEYHGYFQI